MSVLRSKKASCHKSAKRRAAKVAKARRGNRPQSTSERKPKVAYVSRKTLNFYGSRQMRISELEAEKIRTLYVAGLNLKQIGRLTHHDATTVARVVRSEEMMELAEAARKRYWSSAMKALKVVDKGMEKDPWLAHQVLKDVGVAPQQRQVVQFEMSGQKSEAQEEADVLDWTQRLSEVVVRQHKIFNLPLPQLEQLEGGKKDRKRPLLEQKDD